MCQQPVFNDSKWDSVNRLKAVLLTLNIATIESSLSWAKKKQKRTFIHTCIQVYKGEIYCCMLVCITTNKTLHESQYRWTRPDSQLIFWSVLWLEVTYKAALLDARLASVPQSDCCRWQGIRQWGESFGFPAPPTGCGGEELETFFWVKWELSW